jgi:hypothetical protein
MPVRSPLLNAFYQYNTFFEASQEKKQKKQIYEKKSEKAGGFAWQFLQKEDRQIG